MPSALDGEDPELLYRIVQLRSYARMRDRMRSDKERERDAVPQGPVAELVAKVQHMLQEEDARDAMAEQEEGDEE